MQIISNTIINIILVSPLIYFLLLVREYSSEETQKNDQKKIGYLIIYVFTINHHFIGEGFSMGYYLMIYIALIIPFIIYLIHGYSSEKGFKLELFGEKKILNIRHTKFFMLFLCVCALLASQLFVNVHSDQLVLELNKENFNSIRNSQSPLAELAYKSENPSTMISKLDVLMEADADQYEILTSGNWKKEIRLTVDDESSIDTYILTYRRMNSRWKLDGLYQSRHQEK